MALNETTPPQDRVFDLEIKGITEEELLGLGAVLFALADHRVNLGLGLKAKEDDVAYGPGPLSTQIRQVLSDDPSGRYNFSSSAELVAAARNLGLLKFSPYAR